MLEFVITFFVGSIGALVGLWYILKYNYDRQLRDIKGPFAYPLIGNANEFSGSDTILPKIMQFSKEYNGSFRMTLGFDHYIIITDYKRLEFLLGTTKLIKKSRNYDFFHTWLGQGLLTSTGDYWKQNRRIITPTFHFQILEQFLDVFHSNSNIMVEKLSAEVGNPSVDIYPYVTNCALDIICETAMGTSVNAQNQDSEYVRSVKEMCRVLIERSFSPPKQFDFLYRLSRDYQIEKRCLKVLHDYTNDVITRRRDALVENTQQQEVEEEKKDDVGVRKRFAFLDVLLQARKTDGSPMTNEEIRQEVDTFMFEGHDTTASAVSFCLHCLAHEADVQKKVAEELRTIFGADQVRPASYQDLQDMKYLDMVIKETLRLYPSVPAYGREVDNEFQFDGITYPKKTQLLIFAFGIHRNPEYFPDPEKFDPDRFTPEKQMEKQPYCYVPFSAGPRNCVGQKFAVLEIKSAVSKVIRHFELLPTTPKHEVQLVFETILKSSTGIKMQIKKREW